MRNAENVTSADSLFAGLQDPSNHRRVAAAKRLRKLAEPHMVPDLMAALRDATPLPSPPEELWEVQYHLVMALGVAGDQAAVPLLENLAAAELDAAAVDMAIGDALVRLDQNPPPSAGRLRSLLAAGRRDLADGGFRAAAVMRLVFDEQTASDLLFYVRHLGDEEPQAIWRFWPAAAAAGWSGDDVRSFLTECLLSPDEEVREAAEASISGRYKNWHHF